MGYYKKGSALFSRFSKALKAQQKEGYAMRTNKTETKIWDHFQASPTNAERQARGFYFAACPGCRIIFSMQSAQEQEQIERKGCSICRSPKPRSEVA